MMLLPVRCVRAQALAWALLACVLPLAAQEGRDPTIAPGESAAVGPSPVGEEGMTVLVRDGKSFLVVGTRLYTVGDKVGMMRVDRITESEVWLHDGRALIKVQRFAGIERTAVPAKPACVSGAGTPTSPASSPAPVKASKKAQRAPASSPVLAPNSPPAAPPCEDTQP